MILTRSAAAFLGLSAAFAHAQPGPGEEAPPIGLEAVSNVPEGVDASLGWDDLAGKTVVLEYWGTWCAPCVVAIPHLNELAEHFEDADDVVFLSVTFEDTPIVERFLDRRPMRSWVGHDTDESMVEAYRIGGWPTTFIVHDGRIVARTSPHLVTVDVIEAARRGGPVGLADQSAPPKPAPAGGRARPTGGITAGVDPYSTLEDGGLVSVIVREGVSGGGMSATAGPGRATMIGSSVRGVVSTLWDVPSWAVTGEAFGDDEAYDVVVKAPEGGEAAVRALVAGAMGIEVVLERRAVGGLRLRVAESGLTLKPGVSDEPSGSGTRGGPEGSTLTAASGPHTLVLPWLSAVFGVPVEDATGLDPESLYYLEITIPRGEPEDQRAALLKQTGLVLEPAEIVTDLVVVRRAGGAP